MREASRDAHSARQQLEVSPTNSAQALRSKALKSRIERDEELIEQCGSLLYGELSTRLSPRHADVLWLRYCEDEPWKRIAHSLGISITTARVVHDEALRYCDDHNLLSI